MNVLESQSIENKGKHMVLSTNSIEYASECEYILTP